MKKIIITTGTIAVVGGLATAVAVSSCDPCEVDPKPSVIVQVINQDAAESTLARVSADAVWYEWTNEDGEVVTKQAECVDDDCTEWVLGDGQPGVYSFHAKVCGQQFDSSVTLEFNDEGCEVDTRIVDLSVTTFDCPDLQAPEPPEPEDDGLSTPTWRAPDEPKCTLEGRFSVVASLFAEKDGRMLALPADRAYYIHEPGDGEHGQGEGKGHEQGQGKGHEKDSRGDEISGLCLDEACTRFAAGIELEGEFLVGAEACGQIVEATVSVGRTEDGCHVDTQTTILQFDGSKCTDKLDYEATPQAPECPPTGPVPSAYLMPVVQEGDMLRPQATSTLHYTLADDDRGERAAEGYCVRESPNDLCTLWIAGWGLTGEFKAYTEACGIETAVSYTVELAEDGCGPQTRWVPLLVDTRGCIQAPSPEGNPPPETPAAGVDITNQG